MTTTGRPVRPATQPMSWGPRSSAFSAPGCSSYPGSKLTRTIAGSTVSQTLAPSTYRVETTGVSTVITTASAPAATARSSIGSASVRSAGR